MLSKHFFFSFYESNGNRCSSFWRLQLNKLVAPRWRRILINLQPVKEETQPQTFHIFQGIFVMKISSLRGWSGCMEVDLGVAVCGWHTDFMTVINYSIIFIANAVLRRTWMNAQKMRRHIVLQRSVDIIVEGDESKNEYVKMRWQLFINIYCGLSVSYDIFYFWFLQTFVGGA